MVRAASLCLLFAVCIYGVASFSLFGSSATIPVIMWSDKQIFSSPQYLETISTGDVEFALSSLFKVTPNNKESKLASYLVNSEETPEVVVLFVEPELATDRVPIIASAYSSTTGGSFSNLKDALEAAKSSLVIPYATATEFSLLDEPLLEVYDSIKQGSVFISRVAGSELFSALARQTGVKTVEIDSLIAELKSANAFANGVTDLVVVCLDKAVTGKQAIFATHDELIGSISGSIRTATKGNYVAMYSANAPVASRLIWSFEPTSEYERNFYYNSDSNNPIVGNDTDPTSTPTPTPTPTPYPSYNNTNSTKINYFPGALIEVYLMVAIMIAMVFTGGCAIFSLQTPDRWEAPKAKREMHNM